MHFPKDTETWILCTFHDSTYSTDNDHTFNLEDKNNIFEYLCNNSKITYDGEKNRCILSETTCPCDDCTISINLFEFMDKYNIEKNIYKRILIKKTKKLYLQHSSKCTH